MRWSRAMNEDSRWDTFYARNSGLGQRGHPFPVLVALLGGIMPSAGRAEDFANYGRS